MHGTDQDPEEFFEYTRLGSFLRQNGIAFLALEATGKGTHRRFNVGGGSLPLPGGADDLGFVKAILAQVLKLQCIDVRRVYCTGYSNGARFCMMLASMLSGVIAAVAPVSGLRYPDPNDAKRAMPILAFHGTADTINPWAGRGDPTYWNESVLDAYKRWAKFNKCRYTSREPEFTHIGGNIYVAKYDKGCEHDASVTLVKLRGAGHTWPGAVKSGDPWLGKCEKEIKANSLILDFFSQHSMPTASNPAHDLVLAELSEGFHWKMTGTHDALILCALASLAALTGLLGLCRRTRRDARVAGAGLGTGAEESLAILGNG